MTSFLPSRREPRPVSKVDQFLGVLGELMITAGVFLLLFVAWQLWWTDFMSNREQASISTSLSKQWDGKPANTEGTSKNPPAILAPGPGKPFALLHIPRFGSQWQERPVLEGTKLSILEEGVGHYTDTALPGQVGNVSIAGHRVTYGRPFFQIAEMQNGDAIVLETVEGWYTYRMSSHDIVSPSAVEVIAPVPGKPDAVATERYLTLTACHPKYSARERYIVHAKFESFTARATGEPVSLKLPKGVK